ncbi:MAG: DUF937 domain-containing protein [Saprospiraceae bacterium]|nr:DUF937 domain-containing protein [Saprospiraceae bacterium]
MDLMSLLQGHLTEDVINQLSQQTGAAPEQTATAAQGIFSTLIGGLAKNASTEGGASGILSALDTDHDGSILNDVMGLVSGAMQQSRGTTNGAGILGHILGGQQQNAAQMISQTSGVSQNGVMDMMIKLAPMVMGVLGQQNQQQGGLNTSALSGLLGNAVQTQNSNPLMQLATRFLDQDGDGSAIDDIMGMVGSKLLGGMFGGK